MHKLPNLLLAAALSFFAINAFADRVYMKNGDIITGDIKHIWDGELTIEPSYADDFEIDLEEIDFLEGAKQFTLELINGHELEGELRGKNNQGEQIIALSDGSLHSIPLAQLAELDEPEEEFDWDSEISINGNYDKGNTNSENLTVKADTTLKIGDHRHFLDLSTARESQDNISTKEQDKLNYNYNWSFNDPWFLGFTSAYERDPIKDLAYRYTLSPGIGYDFWDDSWRFFTLELSVGYRNEEVEQKINTSATAGWNIRLSHDFLSGDLEAFHNHSVYANVSGRKNNVFSSTSGLKYEIIEDLNFNVELEYDWESNPSGNAVKKDVTLLFGVGYEF